MLLAEAQHEAKDDAAAVRSVEEALPALTGGFGAQHAEVSNARALLNDWSKIPAKRT